MLVSNSESWGGWDVDEGAGLHLCHLQLLRPPHWHGSLPANPLDGLQRIIMGAAPHTSPPPGSSTAVRRGLMERGLPGASPTSRPRGHRVKATPGAAQPHKTALSSDCGLWEKKVSTLGKGLRAPPCSWGGDVRLMGLAPEPHRGGST